MSDCEGLFQSRLTDWQHFRCDPHQRSHKMVMTSSAVIASMREFIREAGQGVSIMATAAETPRVMLTALCWGKKGKKREDPSLCVTKREIWAFPQNQGGNVIRL